MILISADRFIVIRTGRFTVIPSGCLFVISTDRREWRIFTITEMASGGLSGYN